MNWVIFDIRGQNKLNVPHTTLLRPQIQFVMIIIFKKNSLGKAIEVGKTQKSAYIYKRTAIKVSGILI